jgi:outer membrane protein assembly factor BamE (lipoprotein component of BamABCDE complex)
VNYYTADSRRNVREETALMIIPGQTTRGEVFLVLGEPDQYLLDGSRVVYNWAKVKALHPYAPESVQKSSLIITFDERGVVAQREVQKNFSAPW